MNNVNNTQEKKEKDKQNNGQFNNSKMYKTSIPNEQLGTARCSDCGTVINSRKCGWLLSGIDQVICKACYQELKNNKQK